MRKTGEHEQREKDVRKKRNGRKITKCENILPNLQLLKKHYFNAGRADVNTVVYKNKIFSQFLI